jgi:hypothetical protein
VKRGFRVLLVGLVLLVGAATAASAQRGGLRLGLEFGDPTASIVVRPGPFDLKVGYDFSSNAWIFVQGDYRIIDAYRLIDFVHLFLGVGAYAQIYFHDGVDIGVCIPVGLQAFLLNNVLELFLEVAPTVGFLPVISPFERWLGYVGFTILIPR